MMTNQKNKRKWSKSVTGRTSTPAIPRAHDKDHL